MLEQDLFFPELTAGYGALSAEQKQDLGAFLTEVVSARDFPLHVASLWNVYLWLRPGGAELLRRNITDLDRIPARTMDGRARALPVGSFVRVHTETRSRDLWAEVVYKEGRHEEISSDPVPGRLSGAPGSVALVNGKQS